MEELRVEFFCRKCRAQGIDSTRDLDQPLEMGGGIPIPVRMIGNDGKAFA